MRTVLCRISMSTSMPYFARFATCYGCMLLRHRCRANGPCVRVNGVSPHRMIGGPFRASLNLMRLAPIVSQICHRMACAVCALIVLIVPVRAQEASDLVKVELLSEPAAIMPGEPFTVGIKLSMKEHWHTYWRNPGDSGEPTQVTWKLPQGFAAGDLEWPAPSLIRVGPVASFGYEGETILLARVTPPRDLETRCNRQPRRRCLLSRLRENLHPRRSVGLVFRFPYPTRARRRRACGIRRGTQQAAAAIAVERDLRADAKTSRCRCAQEICEAMPFARQRSFPMTIR